LITENTIFILGAGASKPYGYPTALELREEIITNYLSIYKRFISDNYQNSDFDNHPYIKKLTHLIDTFKKSSTSSIDLFLSRNNSFYEIGKQVISFILANYEMESKFREDIIDRKYDWYFALYNLLTKDIVKSDDITKFNDNKISIVTFNYDRSFEHFLHESLLNSFISKRSEINNIIKKFRIIHVYGKLASLPWEDNYGVAYKASHLKQSSDEYASNIKIIYEERESAKEEITTLISESKNIFFLGFGYAQENLEAIGLNKPILNKGQRIYGTALGLTENEIIKNVSLIRANNGHIDSEKFHFENSDSLTLIRDYLKY
jgi:hypothetical protein